MWIRKARLLLQSSDPQPEAEVPQFQPSNQSMPIGNIIRTWLFPKTTQQKMKQQQDLANDDEALKMEEKSCTNDDTRSILISIPDEEMSTKKHLQPSSSSSAQGSCSGGVRNDGHDLTKRKRILDEIPNEEKSSREPYTNKDLGDNAVHEVNVINESTSGSGKKIKRGNVIMEGSRCSRVNGRGWRCCQATLVGYSLCEHHLGKGRLRSKASTIRRPHISTDEGMPSKGGEARIVTKKRTKMLKARSLNSLLGQI